MRGRGKERERERGRERIPSRFHTISTEPYVGLDLTNCENTTWAEIKSQTLNQLSHPGAPWLPFFFLMFVYLFWDGCRERGREGIPRRLCAVSTESDTGLSLMNAEIMTQAKIKSQTLNSLSHPGAPVGSFFICSFAFIHAAGLGEYPWCARPNSEHDAPA